MFLGLPQSTWLLPSSTLEPGPLLFPWAVTLATKIPKTVALKGATPGNRCTRLSTRSLRRRSFGIHACACNSLNICCSKRWYNRGMIRANSTLRYVGPARNVLLCLRHRRSGCQITGLQVTRLWDWRQTLLSTISCSALSLYKHRGNCLGVRRSRAKNKLPCPDRFSLGVEGTGWMESRLGFQPGASLDTDRSCADEIPCLKSPG